MWYGLQEQCLIEVKERSRGEEEKLLLAGPLKDKFKSPGR
jgi:hypothetical protein